MGLPCLSLVGRAMWWSCSKQRCLLLLPGNCSASQRFLKSDGPPSTPSRVMPIINSLAAFIIVWGSNLLGFRVASPIDFPSGLQIRLSLAALTASAVALVPQAPQFFPHVACSHHPSSPPSSFSHSFSSRVGLGNTPVPVAPARPAQGSGSVAGRTLRGRICMFTAQRIKGPCSYHCRTEYYKSSLRIPNPRAARPLFGNIKKLRDRNNQFPNDTLSNKTFLILSLLSPFSLPLPQLDNLTREVD